MSTTQAGVGLGRVFNVLGVGVGNVMSVKECAAWSVIVESSGAATITVQAAKTFTGTPANWTAANGFTQPTYWYQAAAPDGTVAWTKQTASWSTATLTIAATNTYMSVIPFFGTQLADGYCYFKISASANTTYVAVVTHDLQVQRTPANLAKLGA